MSKKDKKVNELDIHIKHAVITEVGLKMTDDEINPLEVAVTVKMVTETGQQVSTAYFSSGMYSNGKINVPVTIHPAVRKIFEELTPVIYEKFHDKFKQLGDGSVKEAIENEQPF